MSRTEVLDTDELLKLVIEDFTGAKQVKVAQLMKKQVSEDAFMQDVEEHIDRYYETTDEVKKSVLDAFREYIFGYFRITPLIEDLEVSDIRILSYENIRIKKKGKRMDAGIRFHSADEYDKFINMIATKNHVNISNLNAIQRFTDNTSSEKFILRFTLCRPLVNSEDTSYLCIRKVPKFFPQIQELINAGMLDKKLAELLVQRFSQSSTLICGGNSSGKTTLLNALKETLPENLSVLVAQQADELTTRVHPDMMFLHSLPGTGESQVSYDLKDISIAGLTMDVDFFIIGEIKGGEALYLLNAAYTGQICAATVHASSAVTAPDKVVDYCMYSSRYSRDELMKMMSCFKTVIFMSDYQVQQVYEIVRWKPEQAELEYKNLYLREEKA